MGLCVPLAPSATVTHLILLLIVSFVSNKVDKIKALHKEY